MGQASLQQFTFSAGELSPMLLGRQDLDSYERGLADMFNALPYVQGGFTRRPGTAYVHTAKFGGDKKVRLLAFQFSENTSFILEFGDAYIRFFSEGGIVTEEQQTLSGITQANPAVATVTGHPFVNGDRVILSNTGSMQNMEAREVIVRNPTADTFECHTIYDDPIDSSGFNSLDSGNATAAKILELTTPYLEADLDQIRLVQSADVAFVLHPAEPIRELARVDEFTWQLTQAEFLDGPYGPLNDTATTLFPGGLSGNVSVTASSTTGVNGGDGFGALDVGRLIRMTDAQDGDWRWLKVTSIVSTTEVKADILGDDFVSNGTTKNWRLGAWSDRTGYPTTGGFHENRLWLGGVTVFPQRIDGSRSGRFRNFAPTDPDGTVADDHAISVSLTSGEVNLIQWLQTDSKGLLLGTAGGEWLLSAASPSEPLTPNGTTARQVSAIGSSNTFAFKAGNATLFVQRSKRELRELAFVFEIDGFRAVSLSVLADHLTTPGIFSEIAFQIQPQPILWLARLDGALIGLTYERSQNVVGWHRHQLGGSGDDATPTNNPPAIESMATIPATDGRSDDTWIVVKRFINGRTERYIELISKVWERGDKQEDAFYVDSGVVKFMDGATSASGLFHLEGETLSVWADGQQHPDVTIENGKFELDIPTDVAILGYGYLSFGRTLPIEGGARDGSSQGKSKRIQRVGFWLMDSLGLRFGRDLDKTSLLELRTGNEDLSDPLPLFTGVTREVFTGDLEPLGQIVFSADTPAPLNVLSLMAQVVTQDDT